MLYAHSGGATIAVLAAQRGLPVAGIVAIAPNLDPQAWTTLHAYSPLDGSLNPVQIAWRGVRPSLFYLTGGEDSEIPTQIVRAAAKIVGGDVQEHPTFNHQCCWQKIWPAVVAAHW
jgi:alpha-beta hydrolase superfamily lysophospholipase